MKKTIIFFLFTLFFLSFIVLPRTDFTDLLQEKIHNYSELEWPEKIYIQTDKPFYALDETIWFAGYLVNGITHTKSTKSWVVYVEIINDKDSIMNKKKLFTNDISLSGDFKIDKDWKAGNYLLRAYTNYMRNDDQAYFFQKEIRILSTEENIESQSPENKLKSEALITEKPDLHFYPEGGYLVENMSNKVAIKIKNDIYSKINVSGYISDNNNDLVAQFSTSDLGLGLFIMTPQPNKSYHATVEINGSEYKYPIPAALPMGYVLNAVTSGSSIIINLKSNTPKGLMGTYLVAHARGEMVYNKLMSEQINGHSLKLPVKDINDGVLTLTLFDPEGNPVCERLVFVDNPRNKGILEIKKDKEILGNREKLSITLGIKDVDGNNLPSHLSMSVRDINSFPYNHDKENIKTWLLLNSDLKGRLKDPGYFFPKETDSKRKYLLDLVMMTNGWRRFTWQSLLYENKDNKFPIEKGITISGTTKHLKKPYTATPAETRMTFFGKNVSQEPIQRSNDQGKFSFGPFIFFDSIQTIVESRLTNFKSEANRDRNVLILIDQDKPSPEVNRTSILKSHVDTESQIENFIKMSKYIKELNFEYEKQIQKLNEVTILVKKESEEDKRRKEMNERTNYGFPSNRLDLEKDVTVGGQSVFDLLNNLPGVSAYNDSISIRGGTGNPKVLLDNFEVDVNFLTTLSANEVSFIDVLKGADAAMFSNAANGVIAVYSKTGNISATRNIKRKPGIIDFAADGFYTAKEFYAPDHIYGFEEANKADIRTTLHWEPKIRVTEQNPTKEISFFSCDTEGDYIIEVEGISDSGIPLHQISTFSVR